MLAITTPIFAAPCLSKGLRGDKAFPGGPAGAGVAKLHQRGGHREGHTGLALH